MRQKGIAGLGAVMFFLILGYSQAQQERNVKEIAGEGFVRQRFENFKSRIETREGKTFSDETADKDVKRLFQTGLFNKVAYRVEDIQGQPNAVKVIFTVEEYNVITDMEVLGVKTKDKDDIQKALRLKKGDTMNPYLMKLDHDYIEQQYQKDGYALVKVDAYTVQKEGGVLLQWEVREGPRTTVDSIEFSGNDHIKASKIKDNMQTQENGWFTSSPFVEANLANDIDRLKVFYIWDGFPEVAKEGSVFLEDIKFNSDRTKVSIKIHITEGERYKVDKIRFEGITLFDEQTMKRQLKLKEGDFFAEGVMYKDVDAIKGKYGERAYIDAEVEPRPVYHKEDKTLDVVFKIMENEQVRVGKVIIKGNSKTRDDVIRQRIKVYPGEPFNSKELDKSIARLRDTRWFKPDIRHEETEGEAPGTKDVTVTVEEVNTGSLRFAAGYNSAFGIVGLIALEQRNFDLRNTPSSFGDFLTGKAFAGGGQNFLISVAPGRVVSSYGLNFYEPYLWGYNYGGGLNINKYNAIWETYDVNRKGAGISVDKKWDNYENLITSLSFDYAVFNINNQTAGSPFDVTSILGKNNEFSLTPRIRYSTLDSISLPTEGYFGEASIELSKGSFGYVRTDIKAGYYWTLLTTEEKRKHVLGVQFELGAVDKLSGSQIPIYARFFGGGVGSIRGFQFRGMGPRFGAQPLGGNAYFYLPVEYSFPIYADLLRGALFWDTADLNDKFSHFGTANIRMSAGFGIRVSIPFLGSAPVSVDFGFPVKRVATTDQKQLVTVNVGILF